MQPLTTPGEVTRADGAPAPAVGGTPARTPPGDGYVLCRNLEKRFPSGTVALDGVSIDCPEARILVLIGPSGCGKTTLLRCVAGLEQPSAGEISIAGRDVTQVPPQQRGVAMVFQNYALYPDKTVAENITFPLRMAKVPRSEQSERLAAIAGLLRLDGLLDRRPAQLSGGQKQRVGIGRALARGPRVLLMDEPLSNLDAQLRVEMRAEILKLQETLGITVLYVTHDQTEAMTLGHRVVVVNAGRVEQAAPPETAFARPASRFVAAFLGAMNLIRGTWEGGALRTDSGVLVDAPARLSGGRRITLGVRPEHVRRGEPGPHQVGFRGRVELVELLGSERLVHLRHGDVLLRMRESIGAGISDELTVCADTRDLHYFDDDEAGRRLDVAEPTS